VRRISRGMMPAGSDAGALLQALEQFAHARQEEGLWCSVRARGDFNAVAPDVAAQLYRIVQEAVTNAQRHGAATRIRVTLAQAGSRYRLTVADNGSGGKLSRIPGWHPGLGLKSMRARAAAIEGQLSLDVGSAGGCRVRVTWELSSPARDAGHGFSAGAT
jgi:signal transduction histidine kinase